MRGSCSTFIPECTFYNSTGLLFFFLTTLSSECLLFGSFHLCFGSSSNRIKMYNEWVKHYKKSVLKYSDVAGMDYYRSLNYVASGKKQLLLIAYVILGL